MLPADEIHLYYLDTREREPRPELLELLSPEERSQHDRFHFDRDRRTYLWAHALTRVVLGRYTGADPASLSFERNPYGKPLLPGIGFNLSHTRGMVVCGVCATPDIGVDVEETTRSTDWRALAPTVFSPDELAGVDTAERFFEQWTLKEAYIKARGMGLSIPLREFTIARTGERLELAGDPGWQFALFAVDEFRIAAAAPGGGWKMRLSCFEF